MLNIQKNYGKSPFQIGKSTRNRPFSTVILNHQRVWELSREFNKKINDTLPTDMEFHRVWAK